MEDYRTRLNPASPVRSAPSTSRRDRLGYNQLGIPDSFNVLADDNLNWQSETSSSVDREYKAYVNGTRAAIDVDLPKYWEVST